MPKNVRLINDFSGGLADASTSRDTPEGSLSVAENVYLGKKGTIQMMEQPEISDFISSDSGLSVGITGQEMGFDIFGIDNPIYKRVFITGVVNNPEGNSNEVEFWTNKPHGFKLGADIQIAMSEVQGGIHTISKVSSKYSFWVTLSADITNVLAHGDVTVDTGLDVDENYNNAAADLIRFDASTTTDSGDNKTLAVGMLLKIHGETELMLITEIISRTEVRVKRGFLGTTASTFDGSSSSLNVYTLPMAEATNLHDEKGNYQMGWVFGGWHTEPNLPDSKRKNLYVAMNSGKMNVSDGEIAIEDALRISQNKYNEPASGNVQAAGAFIQGYKDIMDLGENYLNPSEEHALSSPSMYYVRGGIRVSEGNYKYNTKNTINKLFQYVEPRKFGVFNNHGGAIGVFKNGHSNVDYTTFSQGAQRVEVINTANDTDASCYVELSGSQYTLSDNKIYTARFNIEHVSNNNLDGMYAEARTGNDLANMPLIFWHDTSGADIDDADALSAIFKAKPGYNCFSWLATQNAADSSVHNEHFVKLGGATDTMSLYFYNGANTGPNHWRITNFELFETYAGTQGGWVPLDQEIYAPTNNGVLEMADTVTAGNVDYPEALYMSIENHQNTGTWDTANSKKILGFGYSFLYDIGKKSGTTIYEQESKIFPFNTAADGSGNSYITLGTAVDGGVSQCVEGEFRVSGAGVTGGILQDYVGWNPRIVGARVYLISAGENAPTQAFELEYPLWFATLRFDPNDRSEMFDGTRLSWVAVDGDIMKATFPPLTDVPLVSYETMSNYKHDQTSRYARFKSAAIINNQVFLGNVSIKDEESGDFVHYPDRMIASPPLAYDIFPSDTGFHDFTAMDGDEIIKILSSGSLIFQFKRNTTYVGEIEKETGDVVLKATLKGLGITNSEAAIETASGILWVNEAGCFMFDGENLDNLMQNKIDIQKWKHSIRDKAYVGYSQPDSTVVCIGRNETYVYSFKDEHWVKSTYEFHKGKAAYSNLVSSKDGVNYIDKRETQTGGEYMSSVLNTESVVGSRASGTYTFSGGSITNAAFTIVRAAGNKTTDTFDASGSAFQIQNSLAEAINNSGNTGDNFTAVGISGPPDETGTSTRQSFGVIIYGNHLNTDLNQTGTGTANLYFNGSPDNVDSLTGVSATPLTGGVAAVAGMTSITFDRNSRTAPGQIYEITFTIKKATLNGNIQTLIDGLTFSYTTVTGDTEANICNAFVNWVNSYLGNYLEAANSSNDLRITALAVNPTVSGNEGYYLFQDDISFNVREQDASGVITSWQPYKSIGQTAGGHLPSSYFATSDIFSDSSGQRKKIYKIYITYRCNTDSNIFAYFIGNSEQLWPSNVRKTLQTDSSDADAANYDSTNGFKDTDGKWARAALEPATSSEANNLYSIRLLFEGSDVSSSFAINDINIIYRPKSVK